MTVATNTIQAVARVGIREDLSDKIAALFPDDAPFKAAIGRDTANQVFTEWQTDGLVAANSQNKKIQGDDLTNDLRPNTVRVGNYTQIMAKVIGTSSTLESSSKAGQKSTMARELMKAGKELQTDIESRISGNFAAVPPTATVPGETAGALAWIRTNAGRGATGANGTMSGGTSGYPNGAATNGTQRAYTEALLKPMLAAAWNAGGNPKFVITTIGQKQIAATFQGLAVQRRETGKNKITIVAGADYYVSDVGEVQFVPSRFCSTRDALIVDPNFWELAELTAMTTKDLATTGLATRKAVFTEVGLKCLNEAANAVCADLS